MKPDTNPAPTPGASQADAIPALDVPAGSLSSLVGEWETIVPNKWEEARKSMGHFLSIYSPQWTMREDQRCRREATGRVMQWTVEWFRERGYTVECVLADDGESFSLREANNKLTGAGTKTP